jgi:phosphatidylglycerol---prolipoprotein diacylglyceryl transferase
VTPALAYWVDQFDPFLVHFTRTIGIRYYGLSFAVGFLAAACLLHLYAKAGKSLLSSDRIADFMVAAVLGVVLGGRIGSYFLYDYWRSFRADPFEILRVWDGGMSFHGGLIGVILAMVWFARSQKIPLLHLWDLSAVSAPAGIFFVRIANFINGELWGKPAEVPWAVIFPRSPLPLVPRHPSQLYEAGLEGALLFAYMQIRFWKSDAVRARPGRLAGEFLIFYACVRIFGETFREPDIGVSLILGMSRGRFYSLFMIIFGLFLCFRRGAPLGRTEPAKQPT